MNLQQARLNMVEQQIRTWEVLDHVVLELLEQAPRHEYVPAAFHNLAYADIAVPLGDGEVMMPPRVEARMLQSLAVGGDDRALEIGTGSGFVTALLASLAREVISVEISDSLADMGRRNLEQHGVANVRLERADGVQGWEQRAPYEVIAVTGSVPVLEPNFQNQLAIGGRLFVIVGEAPAMEALLIRRIGEDQWATESLFETVIPKLKGAREPERFVL